MDPKELQRRMAIEITVVADGITWLTVLGNMDLAMRHPGNSGVSAKIAKAFAEALRGKLIETGVVTPDQVIEHDLLHGDRFV